MYCQSCGIAIGHSMRFCNRCGSSVVPPETTEIKRSEKRLDDYLDGLFWITVFGVAFTVGGMVVLKRAGLSDSFLIAFVVLSSTAFLINFTLSLWIVRGIMKKTREPKVSLPSPADTNELDPIKTQPALQSGASVTENTTRSFEPIPSKRNSD